MPGPILVSRGGPQGLPVGRDRRPRAQGARPHRAAGRVPRGDGGVRLGKDHIAQLSVRTRRDRRRTSDRRGALDPRALGRETNAASRRDDGLHLPGVQSDPCLHGNRERRAATPARPRRRHSRRGSERARRSRGSDLGTGSTGDRLSSPAASSSALQSRAHSRAGPGSSGPTSPRETSTRRWHQRSWICCPNCTRKG